MLPYLLRWIQGCRFSHIASLTVDPLFGDGCTVVQMQPQNNITLHSSNIFQQSFTRSDLNRVTSKCALTPRRLLIIMQWLWNVSFYSSFPQSPAPTQGEEEGKTGSTILSSTFSWRDRSNLRLCACMCVHVHVWWSQTPPHPSRSKITHIIAPQPNHNPTCKATVAIWHCAPHYQRSHRVVLLILESKSG